MAANNTDNLFRQYSPHDQEICTAIGVLGILFNGLSLVVFKRRPKLVAPAPRIIIRNQCLLDVVAGVFLIYSEYQSWFIGENIPHFISSPHIYCKLVWCNYILWGALGGSSWNLQLLTVERYVSVRYPILHKSLSNSNIPITTCTIIWVASYAFNAALFIPPTHYYSSDRLCHYEPIGVTKAFTGISLFLSCYIMPILVMFYCYYNMYRSLRSRIITVASVSQEANDQRPSSTLDHGEERNKVKERKTRSFIVTCAIVNITYIICYSCLAVYAFLCSTSVISFEPSSTYYQLSVLMVFANCFVNPVIFAIKIPGFRHEILHWFVPNHVLEH